jgi:hypothetical protein
MKNSKPILITFLLSLCCMLSGWAQEEEDWPLVIEDASNKLVLYQPQIESLRNDTITARAAISLTTPGDENPVFGAVWMKARLQVDRQTRMCAFDGIEVPTIRFPDTEEGDRRIASLRHLLETEIPRVDLRISLDRILASLEMRDQERALAEEFNNEPPEIIFRQQEAILVLIDGEPEWRPFENNFDRLVNTPFFIVRYDRDQLLYLFGSDRWYKSDNLMEGWTAEDSPPSRVRKLEKKVDRYERKEEVKTSDDLLVPPGEEAVSNPEIIVRTHPAELILTRGEPQFASIEGTSLLYVSNTESDLFMNVEDQQYYVLLSGRWYRAKTMEGPWQYIAADAVPEEFADIPEGSEKDIVLANVAGTEAAREALLDAQIPQTATVYRDATIEVEYDGAPLFEPIPGTHLEYAVNTARTVLRIRGRYYCVDNGVWFEASSALGPWHVATSRPEEIERIPPRFPVYNVKYVYIYDYTPDFVYVGYTPGYLGSYIYGPTIVYGTGYWYDPWIGTYYYPHHWTWGFHVHYSPWVGWSLGFYWTNPYRWFHWPYWWQPRPWWYYGGWWGPTYYRPPVYIKTRSVYGPRRETSRIQPSGRPRPTNIYDRYPERRVRSPRIPPESEPGSLRRAPGEPSRAAPRTRRPAERQTEPARTRQTRPENDVYIDREGRVYRRTDRGEWLQRQRGTWRETPTQRPQLEQYRSSRQRGTTRTQNYRDFRRNTSRQTPAKQQTPRRSNRQKNQ